MTNDSHGGAAGGIGLVTVILALVFLFYWPGPFRYEFRDGRASDGTIERADVKIDRISRQVWDYHFDDGKWVKR